MSETLLEVRDLRTHFFTKRGIVKAVDGVDLTVRPREVLGLVGESGCGKSATALSIMGLVRRPGRVVGGTIVFDKVALRELPESELRQIRGNHIAMISQQPQCSLNPVFRIGSQISEALRIHHICRDAAAWQRTLELLGLVGIADPARRAQAYPHELSGGMAQRVMIAMALACNPKLLIADEPTTALDVTIQAQILDLLRSLRSQVNMSVLLITHNMGVIAEMADRVAVMYAGRVVEDTDVHTLFSNPLHPYTQGLLKSMPKMGAPGERLATIPGTVPNLINTPPGCLFASRCRPRQEQNLKICTEREPALAEITPGHRVRCWLYQEPAAAGGALVLNTPGGVFPPPAPAPGLISPAEPEGRPPVAPAAAADQQQELVTVEHLTKCFSVRGDLLQRSVTVKAVDDVSLTVYQGEALGLVGESGCGKTTLGRTILRLVSSTSGRVLFDGKDVLKADRQALQALRRDMQLIFQDPYTSLDPRMRVGESIGEGLRAHGMTDAHQRYEVVTDTLRKVGMATYHAQRYPYELSGGERQRIGIARALALQPRFIVCDEPVSALDVSVQAQVLNLLSDLQREFGLTYLFIAHDLNVVEHFSDRVAVMYLGKVVELAGRNELYRNPLHPYTRALMSAIPVPDPTYVRGRIILQGEVPSPGHLPSGCRFRTRCPLAQEVCRLNEPEYREVRPSHWVACWFAENSPSSLNDSGGKRAK